jgi:Methyltransferase domain
MTQNSEHLRSVYDATFAKQALANSYKSAQRILPAVWELSGPAGSVIDVGCGTGSWLLACQEMGVDDIRGFDVSLQPEGVRLVDEATITSVDLEQRLRVDRPAELVICLEVAEHLSADRADSFVADLVTLGERILFSAAIPRQGGTNHVNEQWQSYWAERFANHSLFPDTRIRSRVWQDNQVDRWYRQNMVLYTPNRQPADELLDVVHPHYWELLNTPPLGLRALSKQLPTALARRVRQVPLRRRNSSSKAS